MSDEESQGTVVSSGAPGQKPGPNRFSRISKIVFVLLAVMIAAAVISLFFVGKSGEDSSDQTKRLPIDKKTNQLQPVTVEYEQLSEAELSDKVNFLIGTKQYSEAEKLIQTQNDLDTSKAKLSLLAFVYSEQDKTGEAASIAEKIVQIGNIRPGEYSLLAQQFENNGDTARAIEYYQKAINAYNTEKKGSYQSNVERLQAKIKELQ